MRHDIDDVADVRLQVLLPCDLRAAPEHEPGETVEPHARPRGIGRAQDLYTLDPGIAADEAVSGRYERYLAT